MKTFEIIFGILFLATSILMFLFWKSGWKEKYVKKARKKTRGID